MMMPSSPFSNAIHPQAHLQNLLKHLSFFSISEILSPISFYATQPNLTSHHPTGFSAKRTLLPSSFLFALLFLRLRSAVSIPLRSPILPAPYSELYVHFLTRPTHSGKQRALALSVISVRMSLELSISYVPMLNSSFRYHSSLSPRKVS